MRGLRVVAVVGGASLAVLACGSAYDADTADGVDAAADSTADAGETSTPEERKTTFRCGSTECIVGLHACCAAGGAYACIDVGGPCAPADAGDAEASAPPPLGCTSYTNCVGSKDCCYRPDTGAACGDPCPAGAVELCTLGEDSCGAGASCTAMPAPPLPGVGQCTPE